MKKRDYFPILAVLIMWLIVSANGSSTPGLESTGLILTIITIPLLVAIVLAILAVHKEHKAEKE
jgi:hypothetical protein